MFRSDKKCIRPALALGLVVALVSQSAHAEDRTPCLQIKTACEQAGFKQGDVGNGNGLQVDCIRPLMAAVPQRAKATRPLPQVDAATILACKKRNPNFGQAKGVHSGGSDDTTDRPPGPGPAPE
jgi:hypothetical protein